MSTLLINIYTSGNEIVEKFRNTVRDEHDKHDQIVVNFVEPGIVYFDHQKQTFVDLIKENIDKKHITYYGCNFSNHAGLPLNFLNNMFHEGPTLYRKNNLCKSLLNSCVSIDQKSKDSKKFDFLMGGTTQSKDWLYDVLKEHKVRDQVYCTYYRDDPKQGSWSKHVKVPVKHTAETIEDKWKSTLRYSDLIDPKIYNQTLYTALIETVDHTDFGVFTEKTAKPIVSKRPFVVFGSPGQLQALQKLGFKTFSTVIDESYDLEIDRDKRFEMVLDSMYELCKKDPKSVYGKLDKILEHNKQHFEGNEWNAGFKEKTKGSVKIDLFRFDR